MKPWDEWRDTERREQIALRLGWVRSQSGAWLFRGPGIVDFVCGSSALLPAWPTNDALAFTAVWPKICTIESAIYLQLRLGKPTVHRISNIDDLTDTVWTGTTWADAICQAAYSLLGVPK